MDKTATEVEFPSCSFSNFFCPSSFLTIFFSLCSPRCTTSQVHSHGLLASLLFSNTLLPSGPNPAGGPVYFSGALQGHRWRVVSLDLHTRETRCCKIPPASSGAIHLTSAEDLHCNNGPGSSKGSYTNLIFDLGLS